MIVATALASAACYALALVLAQLGLRRESALAGATISLPVTACAFWIAAAFTVDPAGASGRALAIFAGCGLFFPVSVTLLSYQGNRLLGPNLAGALGNATPVFAVLFGIVILGDHLTAAGAFGFALIVSGIVLLSLRSGTGIRSWSLLALSVPLSAALIRGLVQPLIKIGLHDWPEPLAATTVGYSCSAVVTILIAAILERGWPSLPSRRSVPIFCGVGLLNGVSVLLLYAALGMGRISLVAPVVAVYPIFTLAFSAAFLRGEERMHPRLLLGIAMTVLGIVRLLTAA